MEDEEGYNQALKKMNGVDLKGKQIDLHGAPINQILFLIGTSKFSFTFS